MYKDMPFAAKLPKTKSCGNISIERTKDSFSTNKKMLAGVDFQFDDNDIIKTFYEGESFLNLSFSHINFSHHLN